MDEKMPRRELPARKCGQPSADIRVEVEPAGLGEPEDKLGCKQLGNRSDPKEAIAGNCPLLLAESAHIDDVAPIDDSHRKRREASASPHGLHGRGESVRLLRRAANPGNA
jgi:hypothetical protein